MLTVQGDGLYFVIEYVVHYLGRKQTFCERRVHNKLLGGTFIKLLKSIKQRFNNCVKKSRMKYIRCLVDFNDRLINDWGMSIF
jgi:hypothetical protein